MHTTRTTIDADVGKQPATRPFDPHRHRRIPGLFDLWLEPGARGGLVLPTKPDRPLDARAITDLVRRSGHAADDVRILTSDGARHSELFSEVAGLLAHDVLVTPDGAEIRHHDRRGGDGPLHAVPVDRATRHVRDWLVIQPPELATPLPGWFAVDRGLVRTRKGVVGLPVPKGVVLATRADFVTRRATAHRLGSAPDGLVTVAVTARTGGFLVGDYGGTQRVYTGGQLAALLGDLPLYGSDLRLWLTWPSDPDEQRDLAAQMQELAETTGATVWTPPPGGSAQLVDGRHDLRALDFTGKVVEWQAHRPRFAGPPALRATPDGLLVPTRECLVITVRTEPLPDSEPSDTAEPAEHESSETPELTQHEPSEATEPAEHEPSEATQPAEPEPSETTKPAEPEPSETTEPAEPEPSETAKPAKPEPSEPTEPTQHEPSETPEPTEHEPPKAEKASGSETPSPKAEEPSEAERRKPTSVPAVPLPRPSLVLEDRRAAAYGPTWLPPGQQVNAEQFEAFVVLPSDAQSITDGIPSGELFLLAFLDPKSAPQGSRLLRVRVRPGGAIPMSELRGHVPARLQHLRGLRESYLLPAARLDQTCSVDIFDTDPSGNLIPVEECDGDSLRIRCAPMSRSIAGLPNDAHRWPRSGTRRAYALLPADRARLPRNWLRLYHRQPAARPGRLLLELRVPRGRAIDVTATADALTPLTLVSTRAEQLHAAKVELILGSRSYARVQVHRAYRAEGEGWQPVRRLRKGPLPVVLLQLHTLTSS